MTGRENLLENVAVKPKNWRNETGNGAIHDPELVHSTWLDVFVGWVGWFRSVVVPTQPKLVLTLFGFR